MKSQFQSTQIVLLVVLLQHTLWFTGCGATTGTRITTTEVYRASTDVAPPVKRLDEYNDTLDGLAGYLRDQPNGEESEEAKRRLHVKLRGKIRTFAPIEDHPRFLHLIHDLIPENEISQLHEELSFLHAATQDTPVAYDGFLSAFPNGRLAYLASSYRASLDDHVDLQSLRLAQLAHRCRSKSVGQREQLIGAMNSLLGFTLTFPDLSPPDPSNMLFKSQYRHPRLKPERILVGLQSPDALERAKAANYCSMGRIRGRTLVPFVPLLVDMLDDDTPLFWVPETRPGDPAPGVRKTSPAQEAHEVLCESSGMMPDDEDQLMRLLASKSLMGSDSGRYWATRTCEKLGQGRNVDLVPALCAAIFDVNPKVGVMANETLAGLFPKHNERMARIQGGSSRAGMPHDPSDALVWTRIGEAAKTRAVTWAELEEALIASWLERRALIVDTMTIAMNAAQQTVRESAAGNIWRLGDESAIEPLLHALSDDWPSVGIAAAKSLGHLKCKKAISPIIDLMGIVDRDYAKRNLAIALARIGGPDVKRYFIQYLERPKKRRSYEPSEVMRSWLESQGDIDEL